MQNFNVIHLCTNRIEVVKVLAKLYKNAKEHGVTQLYKLVYRVMQTMIKMDVSGKCYKIGLFAKV